jgi:PAS domain S-box-containing protein
MQLADWAHAERSERRHPGSDHAREAFFASHSRELRCSLDEELRFLHLDGAWQPLLGWEPKELRGWHLEEIVHPADRARVAKTLARLRAARGCERELEMRVAMPSGGHRLISWTFVAGAAREGSDAFIGLGRDRTAEREDSARQTKAVARVERRNEELHARVEQLEAMHLAVERFAATAAHQLAEPLVIAESSAILVTEELGPELDGALRDRLDAIGRGAARARRLMDALLADARSAGPLELRTVEVGEVVGETLACLDVQLDEYAAETIVGEMPRVRAEVGLLAIIVENLLSNAIKYGPRRGGRIEISAHRHGDDWRLSIAGEGTPIPADEAARIFEPFQRVQRERRVPGVGLGLSICTRLVDRLGGSIGVEPGVDAGNTFWLQLPAAT